MTDCLAEIVIFNAASSGSQTIAPAMPGGHCISSLKTKFRIPNSQIFGLTIIDTQLSFKRNENF